MKSFMGYLKRMSADTLDGYVDDMFATLLSSPIVMIDAADELWEEILTQERKFDRSYREANVLLRISKKQLIDFAEKIFVPPEKLEKNSSTSSPFGRRPMSNRHSIKHAEESRMKTTISVGRTVKLPPQLSMTERLLRAKQQIETMDRSAEETESQAKNEAKNATKSETAKPPSRKNATNNSSSHVESPQKNFASSQRLPSGIFETDHSSVASPMSRRKLSIHVVGRGAFEDQQPSTVVSSGSSPTEAKNGFQLEFLNSVALFPKSRHVTNIEAFRSKLFAYPMATPAGKQ